MVWSTFSSSSTLLATSKSCTGSVSTIFNSLGIIHKQFYCKINLTEKQIRDEGKEHNKSRNEMSQLVKQLLKIHLHIKKKSNIKYVFNFKYKYESDKFCDEKKNL